MSYLNYQFTVSPSEPGSEILMAWISDFGFESFDFNESGFSAYIKEENAIGFELGNLVFDYFTFSYEIIKVPLTNWNAEWEKNYQPEIIGNKIYVRAEFHEANPSYPHEIIVQPRMAFGTGHHPTTSQVMEAMLDIDFKNKSLLDMGCGTGILAILGMQLGASSAYAIDYDPNSVDNSIENAQRNGYPQIEVALGSSELLEGKSYDIILANINRNIILNDLDKYAASLNAGGLLITSGYYTSDLSVIKNKAAEYHIDYLQHTSQNDWCCATFKKQ
jgi:ribosomal protein L11 methyltransferase